MAAVEGGEILRLNMGEKGLDEISLLLEYGKVKDIARNKWKNTWSKKEMIG